MEDYDLVDIPDYGDVMTVQEFYECCAVGLFIDYDGSGRYVEDGKMASIGVSPSSILKKIDERFTHVVWFNR